MCIFRILIVGVFLSFLSESAVSLAQQGQAVTRSEPYRIGIFPADGYFGALNTSTQEVRSAHIVRGRIQANEALVLAYSYYHPELSEPRIVKRDRLWTEHVTLRKPRLGEIKSFATQRKLDGVVMAWGDSPSGWVAGRSGESGTNPVFIYMVDVEREKVYVRKGTFDDVAQMAQQVFTDFLRDRPPVIQAQAAAASQPPSPAPTQVSARAGSGPVPSAASQPPPPAQTQVAIRPGSGPVTLTAGTTLGAVLFQHVNSGLNAVGETVDLKVTDDVRVGGQVVIAKGARVKAQVGNIGQRGMMGKGGDISFSPVSVQAIDGQWVPLDKDQLGARGAGASVGEIIGIGLWAKGRAAFVLRGQLFDVSIRRDTLIETTKVMSLPTLRRADVQISATADKVKRINFARAKVGDDIAFNIQLTPEVASLVGQAPGAVQIVKVHEDVLYDPVKAMSVETDSKKSNMLKAVFSWWSVIKYAQPGTTPIVLQCPLSDGRVAQAQTMLTTEFKLE